jgi:outer membrane protein assembly factor BamE (lipoprotein component of BamABCDE complex)
MIPRFLLPLIPLALLSACAAATHDIGRPVDAQAAQQLEVGKSTEADVLALLGPPLKKKINPDGSKIYGYGQIKARAYALPFYAKGRASGDKVLINFNRDGVITSVETSHLPD